MKKKPIRLTLVELRRLAQRELAMVQGGYLPEPGKLEFPN
jgi:hypothetical protein